MLHSWHQGFAWTDSQVRGILAGLEDAGSLEEPEIYHFYLDNRVHPEHLENMLAALDLVYAHEDLDLIISTDNVAFEVARDLPWRTSRGIPLVFSGVNNFRMEELAGRNDITGVAENFVSGRLDTVRMIQGLMPRAGRVVFILDASSTSRAIRQELDSIRAGFRGLEFAYVVEEDLGRQLDMVRRLEPGTVLVPIGVHRDPAGALVSYEKSMELIAGACPVPAFGFIENRIGHGIVGGKILFGEAHGRVAGAMAARILSGERPASLPPVMDNPGELIVDWKMLERHGLDAGRLQGNVRFINRPREPLLEYWYIVLPSLVVLGVLVLLVIKLVHARRRLLGVIKALAAKEELLASYIDQSPDPITVTDGNGRFILVNRKACELSGYSRDELLGMGTFDMVVPGEAPVKGGETDASGDSIVRFRARDGHQFSLQVRTVKLKDGTELGLSRDVTDMLKALDDKDILVEELFHRTRNNLFLVNSLMMLFGVASRDRNIQDAFHEMAGRIQVMALVHEGLHGAEDVSRIQLGPYFRSIARFFADRLRLEVDGGDCTFPMDRAQYLGLVVYELLLASSRNHDRGGEGVPGVRLAVSGGGEAWLRIAYDDQGLGRDQGLDLVRSDHVGAKTARALVVDQLSGHIEELREDGRGRGWILSVPQGDGSMGARQN